MFRGPIRQSSTEGKIMKVVVGAMKGDGLWMVDWCDKGGLL